MSPDYKASYLLDTTLARSVYEDGVAYTLKQVVDDRWSTPTRLRDAWNAGDLQTITEASLGIVFGVGKYARRTEVNHRSATDVNATFPDGWSPPYKPGTRVTEFTSAVDDVYVRAHGADNIARSWMMKREAIEGLTPEQIRSKFALPETPTQLSEVHVPAGTRVRTGIANPGFGGVGNAIQYELLQRLPTSAFRNTVKLVR